MLVFALAAFVVAGTCATLLPLVLRCSAWLSVVGAVALVPPGVLAIALVLAGPLAAFAIARTSEEVTLWPVIDRALERVRGVFVVTLACGIACSAAALLIVSAADDAYALGALLAFASYLAATFVLAPGFLGLGDALAGTPPPRRVFHRAVRLSRGHRALTLVALAIAGLPAIAGSTSAFATSFRLGPLAVVVPIVGGAISVYSFTLLAVATHAVASGEGRDDA